jgi:hypothetical protein
MKNIFSSFLLFLVCISLVAQHNPTQNSNVPASNSSVEKEKTSTNAESQVTVKSYISSRSSYINKNDKSISKDNQAKLDALVENMEEANANSFEFNYAMYLNENRSIRAFSYLQKAAEIYPNNENLNKDFIHHFELTNDINKRNLYCKKLYETNTIESSLMEYNYNVLMSIPKNGVLFTYGSDDTYPLFVWQSIKKVRADVQIINIEMLSEELYRTNKSKDYGLKIQWKENIIATSEWIIKNNSSKVMCLGHTVSPKLLQNLKAQLYLTGLTYQYATVPLNNIDILLKNYELFQMDQLKKIANYSTFAKLNANYILPMITVLEYFRSTNQTDKAKQLRDLIIKVAQQQGTDFENKINTYMVNMGL